MKTLCIIPARSGSKGVPGKNIKLLNGRPLIAYTFDAAIESRLIDRAILSTDSTSIASLAASTMIEVPFMRPSHLSADHTPTAEVIKHALNYFTLKAQTFDAVCLLQATCPFRSRGFVDKCIKAFNDSGADCLFSVKKVPHEYNPHWVFTPGGDGFLQISTGDESIIPNRQLLPPAYARDGSVYVFKADNILLHNNIYGKTISYLESDSPWHVNIDTPEDWKQAEIIASLATA